MKTASECVELHTTDGPMMVVVARPAEAGSYPAIIIAQEAFGVNDHIRDLTHRFATEGYLALAPDLFHRAGRLETAAYGDRETMGRLREGMSNDGTVSDLDAVVDYLRKSSLTSGANVGITGYCMGGRVSFLAACQVEGIGAAAVYYGGGIVPRVGQSPNVQAPIDMAHSIECPIIGFFGGQDHQIPIEAVDEIRQTLDRLGKESEVIVYPKAGHGFFCDDRESYDRDASVDAWTRTLTFFDRHLRPTPVVGG